MEMITVVTPTCVVCKQSSILTVPAAGYAVWKAGALIQDALPTLDVDTREQLMTGTHPACWDAIFGDDPGD